MPALMLNELRLKCHIGYPIVERRLSGVTVPTFRRISLVVYLIIKLCIAMDQLTGKKSARD
jgi:hypothetical protein